MERTALAEICEAARVRGRQRQVLELLAEGVPAEQIAVRLNVSRSTVHVHAHRARQKLLRARERHEQWELLRFLIYEVIPGPLPSDPPTPHYRVLPSGDGEVVRVNVRTLVTPEDVRRGG